MEIVLSHRIYTSNAERQRAYRQRQRGPSPCTAIGLPPPAITSRVPSRPARLQAVLADVRTLAAEYQSWRDRLPPNLAEGQTAAQIEEVIAQLEEAAEILEAIDPPTVGRRPGARAT